MADLIDAVTGATDMTDVERVRQRLFAFKAYPPH